MAEAKKYPTGSNFLVCENCGGKVAVSTRFRRDEHGELKLNWVNPDGWQRVYLKWDIRPLEYFDTAESRLSRKEFGIVCGYECAVEFMKNKIPLEITKG